MVKLQESLGTHSTLPRRSSPSPEGPHSSSPVPPSSKSLPPCLSVCEVSLSTGPTSLGPSSTNRWSSPVGWKRPPVYVSLSPLPDLGSISVPRVWGDIHPESREVPTGGPPDRQRGDPVRRDHRDSQELKGLPSVGRPLPRVDSLHYFPLPQYRG